MFCHRRDKLGSETPKQFNRRPLRPTIRTFPKRIARETIVQASIYVCMTMKTPNPSTGTELSGVSSLNSKEPLDGNDDSAALRRSKAANSPACCTRMSHGEQIKPLKAESLPRCCCLGGLSASVIPHHLNPDNSSAGAGITLALLGHHHFDELLIVDLRK